MVNTFMIVLRSMVYGSYCYLPFQGALIFYYCALPNAVRWVRLTCPFGAIFVSVIRYSKHCGEFNRSALLGRVNILLLCITQCNALG